MDWININSASTIIGAMIALGGVAVTIYFNNRALDKRQVKQLQHDNQKQREQLEYDNKKQREQLEYDNKKQRAQQAHELLKSQRDLMTLKGEELYRQFYNTQCNILLLSRKYAEMLKAASTGDHIEFRLAFETFTQTESQQLTIDTSALSMGVEIYFPNIGEAGRNYIAIRDDTLDRLRANIRYVFAAYSAKDVDTLEMLLRVVRELSTEVADCSDQILVSIANEVRKLQGLNQTAPSGIDAAKATDNPLP